ncbi:MAG TPA: hypothetical protein VLZ07_06775 [Syntrophales bacterium]|nr:hypothetical protein [Syntrophales bacterium]
MGWIEGTCFVHQLLPFAGRGAPVQTELDWPHESQMKQENLSDLQITFLDELEKLIIQKKF